MKSEFRYDAATDTYLCPAGQRLVPLYRFSPQQDPPRGAACQLRQSGAFACPANYATDAPSVLTDTSPAMRTKP